MWATRQRGSVCSRRMTSRFRSLTEPGRSLRPDISPPTKRACSSPMVFAGRAARPYHPRPWCMRPSDSRRAALSRAWCPRLPTPFSRRRASSSPSARAQWGRGSRRVSRCAMTTRRRSAPIALPTRSPHATPTVLPRSLSIWVPPRTSRLSMIRVLLRVVSSRRGWHWAPARFRLPPRVFRSSICVRRRM